MTALFFGTKGKIAEVFFIVMLASSVSFFAVPQPVHAGGIPVYDALSFIETALDWVANYSADISSADIAGSTNSIWVKEYVLDPLAWMLSQTVLQSVTGSVVKFVNGGNGMGVSMFVQNLQGHLQTVGDTQTSAFLMQFAKNSNSPFAAAISSSLRTNYLQGTSLAGFWASNQCTLSKVSPNVNKFLAGDWSQGGAAAWFALTTQDQNNPYALYQRSQSELGSTVGSAQAARSSQINNGQGFLSFCAASSAVLGATGVDIADPCTNTDGTPGIMQTPGIIIHDQLAKTLGAGVDKIVSADEISEVLGQVAVSFVSNILGTSGGLAGSSKPSPTGRSIVDSYVADNPINSAGGPSATSSASTNAQSKIGKIDQYESDWAAIAAAANSASASVVDLVNYCTAQVQIARSNTTNSFVLAGFINNSTAVASSSQTALIKEISPVLAQAAQENADAEKTRALVLKIQEEANSTDVIATSLATDLSLLQAMKPTARDLSDSHAKTQRVSGAAAQLITLSPPGSLNVSDNNDASLVDLMNLLSANATALKSSCDMQAYLSSLTEDSSGNLVGD